MFILSVLGRAIGLKTTEVNGQHVPHVIIDNVEINVDVDTGTLATAARQDSAKTTLDSIDTSLNAIEASAGASATAAKQDTAKAVLDTINTSLDNIETGQAAQSTAANQATGNTSLGTIVTAQGAPADAEATGNGSIIAILKRIRTLLGLVPQFTMSSLGIQALTISTNSVSLTVPGGTKHAVISLVGTAGDYVRFRTDTNAVTSTTGQKIIVGDYIDWSDPGMNYANLLAGLRLIRDTGATADVVAHIEYYD